MRRDSARVAIGDVAPDFEAMGTGNRMYRLSDYRGHPLVLVFYPGDGTPVCTEQLLSYTADFSEFEKLDAEVLALSPQDVESHEAFSESHGGFAFPLLHDEGKRIGRLYGVLGPLGFYRRSIFVIDAEGIVREARRSSAGLGYASVDDLVAVLSGPAVKSAS